MPLGAGLVQDLLPLLPHAAALHRQAVQRTALTMLKFQIACKLYHVFGHFVECRLQGLLNKSIHFLNLKVALSCKCLVLHYYGNAC